MVQIVSLINSLPNMLPLKPASAEQITNAEHQLNICFAAEYKEYLSAFGAIMADGIELSGIAKSEHRNVVYLTQQQWKLNLKVPHTMYVVENTCVDGIVIWQDNNGSVYQTKANSEPFKIASSLEEYILNQVKRITM